MGLKDRLATRKRPSLVYSLRIDDDSVPRAELAAAQAAGDEKRIAVATEAIAACYEQVTIVALPPGPGPEPTDQIDMETLTAAHPPTDEQRAKDRRAVFNKDTFFPALLAACIQSDPPVTADEWQEYTTTGSMTAGEVNDLLSAVWNINYRTPDPAVPKG